MVEKRLHLGREFVELPLPAFIFQGLGFIKVSQNCVSLKPFPRNSSYSITVPRVTTLWRILRGDSDEPSLRPPTARGSGRRLLVSDFYIKIIRKKEGSRIGGGSSRLLTTETIPRTEERRGGAGLRMGGGGWPVGDGGEGRRGGIDEFAPTDQICTGTTEEFAQTQLQICLKPPFAPPFLYHHLFTCARNETPPWSQSRLFQRS